MITRIDSFGNEVMNLPIETPSIDYLIEKDALYFPVDNYRFEGSILQDLVEQFKIKDVFDSRRGYVFENENIAKAIELVANEMKIPVENSIAYSNNSEYWFHNPNNVF